MRGAMQLYSHLRNLRGSKLYFPLKQVEDFGTDYSKPDICQTYLRAQVRGISARWWMVHACTVFIFKSAISGGVACSTRARAMTTWVADFFGSETQMTLQPMATNTVSYFKDTREGIKPVQKSSVVGGPYL
jgi:hypothetical protein